MRIHQSHAVTKVCSLELSLATCKIPCKKKSANFTACQSRYDSQQSNNSILILSITLKENFYFEFVKTEDINANFGGGSLIGKVGFKYWKPNSVACSPKWLPNKEMSAVTIQWEHREPVPCFAILTYKLVLSLLGNALLNLCYSFEKHISDLHWCYFKWAKFGP